MTALEPGRELGAQRRLTATAAKQSVVLAARSNSQRPLLRRFQPSGSQLPANRDRSSRPSPNFRYRQPPTVGSANPSDLPQSEAVTSIVAPESCI